MVSPRWPCRGLAALWPRYFTFYSIVSRNISDIYKSTATQKECQQIEPSDRLSSHRGSASLDLPLSQNTCLTGSLAHRASAPAGWRHGVLLSSTVPGNILYPSLCPQLKEATLCSPLVLYTRQYHYREAAVVMHHSRDSVNVDISM